MTGCLKIPSLRPSEQVTAYYSIDYPLSQPVTQSPIAETLLVRRLQTSALYNSDRLVSQTSPFLREFFYYKRWAVNPGSMLSDCLFRDLSGSGLFKAVLGGPGYLTHNHELAGTLEVFHAFRTPKGWHAELCLNMLFFPYAPEGKRLAGEKIFQKRYSAVTPCQDGSAEAIVASLSACMKTVSDEFLLDLREYLLHAPRPQSREAAAPLKRGR